MNEELHFETVKIRSALTPRWWQIRRRFYWWRLKRDTQREILDALDALQSNMERSILFGDGVKCERRDNK